MNLLYRLSLRGSPVTNHMAPSGRMECVALEQRLTPRELVFDDSLIPWLEIVEGRH